jgi:RNA polymerase sigma-70 factor (ECF subfamily)
LKNAASKEELFIDFLEKNKGLIVKVAGVYCNDHDERRDLIQDIILQLWRAFPAFNGSASITTWTYRIALNVSISYLRKSSTRKKTQEGYRQQTSFIEWDAHFKDERLELLYHYINFLKPMDKAIIILHLDGIKNKEVAEIVGIKPTTVSTRLQRIKDILSTHLITVKN